MLRMAMPGALPGMTNCRRRPAKFKLRMFFECENKPGVMTEYSVWCKLLQLTHSPALCLKGQAE